MISAEQDQIDIYILASVKNAFGRVSHLLWQSIYVLLHYL